MVPSGVSSGWTDKHFAGTEARLVLITQYLVDMLLTKHRRNYQELSFFFFFINLKTKDEQS